MAIDNSVDKPVEQLCPMLSIDHVCPCLETKCAWWNNRAGIYECWLVTMARDIRRIAEK